ncbi:hypothetical protein H0X09_00675 [Candidatus Saccharibacteria bacterium]|nr:hypothetical protein [Candidatus Saccharibacteria bacterium]
MSLEQGYISYINEDGVQIRGPAQESLDDLMAQAQAGARNQLEAQWEAPSKEPKAIGKIALAHMTPD